MPKPAAAPPAFSSDVLTDDEIASLRIFMSWPMRDIASRFGLAVAQRIVAELGGQYVYLPDKPKADHPLVAVAGAEVLRFLATMPGVGSRIVIPTCKTAQRQMREVEVLKLVRNGASVGDLAKRYKIHVRAAATYKAKAVREIQAEVVRTAEARRKAGFVEPASLLTDAEMGALHLPFAWPLADVAARFGLLVALRLIRELGGKAIKLPTQARETHPIAACAGIEVLRFVMELPRPAWKRDFVLSPSAIALRDLRRAEIDKLLAAGGGIPEIVLRFGVDVSTAITWLGFARGARRGATTHAPPDPEPPA